MILSKCPHSQTAKQIRNCKIGILWLLNASPAVGKRASLPLSNSGRAKATTMYPETKSTERSSLVGGLVPSARSKINCLLTAERLWMRSALFGICATVLGRKGILDYCNLGGEKAIVAYLSIISKVRSGSVNGSIYNGRAKRNCTPSESDVWTALDLSGILVRPFGKICSLDSRTIKSSTATAMLAQTTPTSCLLVGSVISDQRNIDFLRTGGIVLAVWDCLDPVS